MESLLKTTSKIFSSYKLNESIVLFFNYIRIIARNRLVYGNRNKEKFLSFMVEFPYRPAFFGLLMEIFFRPLWVLPKSALPLNIFDCGANIGVRMLYFRWRYPNSTITCFEPNPETIFYLNKNIKNNHLSGVTVLPFALGMENGRVRLYRSHNERGSGSATTVKPNLGDETKKESFEVEVKKLSEFINSPIDFLKIDIEGAESEVLEDLWETKKIDLVKNMLIEYHFDGINMKYPIEKFMSILKNSGFKISQSPLEEYKSKTGGPAIYTCMIYAQR